MEEQESEPSPEQILKASDQGSALLGVAGYLNNLGMLKPDFGPDDLAKLALGLKRLAGRLGKSRTPLPETEIMPGMKAVIITERDLNPQPPTSTSTP